MKLPVAAYSAEVATSAAKVGSCGVFGGGKSHDTTVPHRLKNPILQAYSRRITYNSLLNILSFSALEQQFNLEHSLFTIIEHELPSLYLPRFLLISPA
jgi:hypothetical protein